MVTDQLLGCYDDLHGGNGGGTERGTDGGTCDGGAGDSSAGGSGGGGGGGGGSPAQICALLAHLLLLAAGGGLAQATALPDTFGGWPAARGGHGGGGGARNRDTGLAAGGPPKPAVKNLQLAFSCGRRRLAATILDRLAAVPPGPGGGSSTDAMPTACQLFCAPSLSHACAHGRAPPPQAPPALWRRRWRRRCPRSFGRTCRSSTLVRYNSCCCVRDCGARNWSVPAARAAAPAPPASQTLVPAQLLRSQPANAWDPACSVSRAIVPPACRA
jgi:hypothetical protein